MATSTKSSSPEPKKVFDIAKPNQSVPDSTSKPLISGHKPLVDDPMVKEDAMVNQLSPTDTHEPESKEPAKEKTKPPSVTKTVIKPLTDEQKSEDGSSVDSSSGEDVDKSDVEEEEIEEKAPVGAVLKDIQTTKQVEDAVLAREEKIQSLVESGEYNVKLGTAPQHKSDEKLAWVVVAFLLLAGVGLYLAGDAELINTSVKLPVDLIK